MNIDVSRKYLITAGQMPISTVSAMNDRSSDDAAITIALGRFMRQRDNAVHAKDHAALEALAWALIGLDGGEIGA